jgi:hypothetical protein
MANQTPTSSRLLVLLTVAALAFAGCADTSLKSSWTAPGVTKLKFNKMVVIALAANRNFNRKMAESAVANSATRVKIVPSYELLPGLDDVKNKATVIKMIQDNEFDGVITMRIAATDTRVMSGSSTALPMDYLTFSGYYGSVYDVSAYYLDDGNRATYQDKIISLEVNIYDVKTMKLVWSATTQTIKDAANPGSVPTAVQEVAKVIRAKLQDEKLVN